MAVLRSRATEGMWRTNHNGCKMLRVCFACCNNRFHRLSGNDGSALHGIATKWSLKVWIAFAALLHQWSWGGTSWNFMLLAVITFLKSLEHLLLRISCLGTIPAGRMWSIDKGLLCQSSLLRFYSSSVPLELHQCCSWWGPWCTDSPCWISLGNSSSSLPTFSELLNPPCLKCRKR